MEVLSWDFKRLEAAVVALTSALKSAQTFFPIGGAVMGDVCLLGNWTPLQLFPVRCLRPIWAGTIPMGFFQVFVRVLSGVQPNGTQIEIIDQIKC